MYLLRIHIRPYGGSATPEETFEYCKKNGLLGVGWRINSNTNITDWDEYFSAASKIYENLNVCKYIKKWVSKDDLVWTRDTKGEYYLAKVVSGWEYFVDQEAIDKDIDIANIFRVELKWVPIDRVPGKVIACFRAQRTIQEIADEKAVEYSKFLWNSITGTNTYAVDTKKFSDIFMLLDDEETEDLVFLYLQSLGWYVVPNSRKADSMSFEYMLICPKTREKALAQIKTGNVSLNKEEYKDYKYKIFLFQSNDLYHGADCDNVTIITRKELNDFIKNNLDLLPGVFKIKFALASGRDPSSDFDEYHSV
jgi:hypothetical protein